MSTYKSAFSLHLEHFQATLESKGVIDWLTNEHYRPNVIDAVQRLRERMGEFAHHPILSLSYHISLRDDLDRLFLRPHAIHEALVEEFEGKVGGSTVFVVNMTNHRKPSDSAPAPHFRRLQGSDMEHLMRQFQGHFYAYESSHEMAELRLEFAAIRWQMQNLLSNLSNFGYFEIRDMKAPSSAGLSTEKYAISSSIGREELRFIPMDPGVQFSMSIFWWHPNFKPKGSVTIRDSLPQAVQVPA